MKKAIFLSVSMLLSSMAFGQQSFSEILAANRNGSFLEIIQSAESYFADKYPDKSPFELTFGEHRDGEYVKYRRWREFWKSRLEREETLADLSKYHRLAESNELSSRSNGTYDDLEWSNISYANDLGVQIGLGRTSCLAFHPTDPNTFYVGAANGGVWKTTDGGFNYTPIGDDLPYLAVSSIIVNQDNPDQLFIAISDRVWYGPSSIGVYKSDDDGNTWEPTALSFDFSNNVRIYWMEADPNDPDIMWVGTSNGLYQTVDAFESVDSKAVGIITDVKFKPGDSEVLYYVRNNPNRFYRSQDGGETFSQIESFGGNGYMRIVTTALNPDKVYVSRDNVLHKSTDTGLSFPQNSNLSPANVNDGIVMISPANESSLYLGFFDMYHSATNGFTFNQISHWLGDNFLPIIHVDQRNAFINPLQNDRIYLCNDGGVYTVNVNTNEFTNLSNGLVITQFFDIAVSQSDAEVMSGGSQDNGNVFMEPNGWVRAAPTADGMMQAIDPLDENVRYNAIQVGTIFRFINGTRVNISNNIPGNVSGNGEWVTPFLLDPNDPTTIYAAYKQVYRSTNRGNTWIPISNELASGRNLDLIAVAPTNSDRIYAVENFGISTGDLFGFGHSSSTLYVKNTEDNTWVSKDIPVTESVEEIVVDPSDSDVLYISLAGYSNNHKVFRSVNAGDNWENISDGLPNVPCTALAFYEGAPSVWFAGTDAGVYYLEEGTNEWLPAGDFPNTYITDIEIQEAESLIRVGTHGRGILEGSLLPPVTNTEEWLSETSDCFLVAPNPTKNLIQITDFPSGHWVHLYNVKGELIRLIEKTRIDLSSFPEGIYYLVFINKADNKDRCVQRIMRG